MVNSENTEESSLSFSTTTYTYELDFVQEGFTFDTSWFSRTWNILKDTTLLFATVSVSTIKISWEALVFLVYFAIFVQKKGVSFVYFLEDLKDSLVKLLLWRRGLLFRPTVHGGVLVLASAAFVVGSLFRAGVVAQDFSREQVLTAVNTTETTIPADRPRSEVVKYTVKKGDTFSEIAAAFNLSVASIKWANNIDKDTDTIKPGDTLAIPPVTGVIHKVKKGETLVALAKKYKADAQTIADYPFNYIDDSLALRAAQTLIIPGGVKPQPTPLPASPLAASRQPVFYAGGSGLFGWPVAGSLNQSPSWWHPAIDIGAAYGSLVQAASAGKVITAGWNSFGFGNYVVIDHGNGYTTAYAHMGSIKIRVGQSVGAGQLVGTVGCTGFCTGPHLHFEIRRGGTFLNPLSLLP